MHQIDEVGDPRPKKSSTHKNETAPSRVTLIKKFLSKLSPKSLLEIAFQEKIRAAAV